MTENDVNSIYTPWNDDEIEFLKGDWKIRRDVCYGLYRYSISGIECQQPVDAVQLLDWKMAKICDYPCMHPWDRSDISFVDNAVVIRDPVDISAPKNKRGYILDENGLLFRVNKYFLVRAGYAECGEKTMQEIEKVKLERSSGTWYSDGIVLIPKKNVIVKMTLSKGLYQITYNGIKSVRNADYLIKSGLAVKLFDAKFDKLVKCKSITMTDLRKQTCDFWFSPNSASIASLREIARAYSEVETGGVKYLLDRLKSIFPDYEIENSELDKIESLTKEFNLEGKNLRTKYSECQELYKKFFLPYEFVKVSDAFSKEYFDDKYNLFIGSYNSAFASADRINEIKDELESFMQKEFVNPELDINVSIFPKIIAEKLSVLIEKKREYVERYEAVSDEAKKLQKQKYEKELISANDYYKNVEKINKKVKDVISRRAMLDSLYSHLSDEKRKSKRYVINKTYKNDRIRFITALKIKHVGNGKYVILNADSISNIALYADDLVYMKLAKRI